MSKTVLITGAAGGMGFSYTKVFGEKGYDMVIVDVKEDKLLELKPALEKKYDCKVTVIAEDLSKDEAAKKIFDKTKELGIDVDLLVNNAGFGDFGRYIDIPYERERAMVGVNIISLMYLTHLYANDMMKRGGGKILNIASIAAYLPGPYMPVYYASKAFVYAFSEAVAHELKGSGVTVTAFCPGPTKTGFEKNAKMKGSKLFKFRPLQGGSADETARHGYDAVMSGKLLGHAFRRHDVFKFITKLGSEKLKLMLCTYINTGKLM